MKYYDYTCLLYYYIFEWRTTLLEITEKDSGCMQYWNLIIRYIVDQTPRHRLRSCFWSNNETPAQIMLPCMVGHTVSARHRTKKIKPSVEISSCPPFDLPAPCQLQQWWGWQRRRVWGRRRGGGVRAGATWMWAPLLYPVGILIFSIYIYILCMLPRPCGGTWQIFVWKSQVSKSHASWIYFSKIQCAKNYA